MWGLMFVGGWDGMGCGVMFDIHWRLKGSCAGTRSVRGACVLLDADVLARGLGIDLYLHSSSSPPPYYLHILYPYHQPAHRPSQPSFIHG